MSDERAPAVRVGVQRGRHRLVPRIAPIRIDSGQVETLNVEKRAEQSLLEHLAQEAADAPRREAAHRAVALQGLSQSVGQGPRDATGTGLEREAVHQQPRGIDRLSGSGRNLQADGIVGRTSRAGEDAERTADRFQSDHEVDLVLASFDRAEGKAAR